MYDVMTDITKYIFNSFKLRVGTSYHNGYSSFPSATRTAAHRCINKLDFVLKN